MSKISSKDTKPEILVRKFLFSKGFRYRINVKTLPGKPDIVLPKYKTIIFVNGCFGMGIIAKRENYHPQIQISGRKNIKQQIARCQKFRFTCKTRLESYNYMAM